MHQNPQILLDKIGVKFDQIDIFSKALVHRSYLNEHKELALASNEKLEFLGDSVLSLVTTKYLFTEYPEYNEGDYTDIKATIVRTESLADAARILDLGRYLMLSRGEEENGGRNNTSILADTFESIIGIIYLEKGLDQAEKFIIDFLFSDTLKKIIETKAYLSSKNQLQEYYQEKFRKLPKYEIIDELGPSHDRTYIVGVFDDGRMLGKGQGRSKKSAEEEAARQANENITVT